MRTFLLTVSILILCADNYGQPREWTVKSGQSIQEALGDSVIFRYPQFELGAIWYRNGTVSTARLNLNLVNGEMEFIDPSDDTMTIADEATIKCIVIQTDSFYFDKVFVELIYSNATAKLAKVTAIGPFDIEKVGGYDYGSPTSSINSISYFSNGNQFTRLAQNKLLVLRKKSSYFIGDNFNHFLPASKKNTYKLFSKQEQVIDDFLKDDKIVFVKEDDLVKLIDILGKNN